LASIELDRGNAVKPGLHLSFEDPADFLELNTGQGAPVEGNFHRADDVERSGSGPRA